MFHTRKRTTQLRRLGILNTVLYAASICKFVCAWGVQNPISGTRAAFADPKTGILMGTVPSEPPVLAPRTRTQEQVGAAFTWRSDGFSR
eukprot:COSAG06_NODE_622_length_13723_cov_258.262184_16_plen_89_part_00